MHNADNGHYVLFGLCVAAITLSTVRLHRLPSSLTVAPVKRMRCVDLMPVGCCVWVWVDPRGLFASSGGPCRVVRRRATLPHPVGCSTIAVPGLSFRVRNGTGRLTWAMAAANLLLYGQTLGSAGLWRPGNRTADADMSMFRLVARQCSLPSGVVCRRKMRSNRQGLECWCCLSSVSTGRLHPSRGFHVRPIDHVFCMGTTGTRRFHGMLILEQASRLDAFSGYPFRT